MSKLSKDQRDKLPASDYGDPARRLFPIVDQDDVDSAARLIGKAANPEAVKKRIIAICKRKGLTVPDAWQAKNSADFTATFDGAPTVTGDLVIRSGKVFECGEYPDKGFELTPEEALAVVADFAPVPLDLEHMPTVLDGKLGTLEAVELDANGYDLIGRVALPRWLHDALGAEPIKVSGTFDRETKRLSGLALVNHPRVPDAAIMAAFARHDTYEGQGVIQNMHDIAARAGAVCNRADTAQMHSSHELEAIQAMHDTATGHGAKCSDIGKSPPWGVMYSTFAAFAGQRHSAADLKDLQTIHDLTTKQGATCAPARMHQERGMSDKRNTFLKWLLGDGDDDTVLAAFGDAEQAKLDPKPTGESDEVKQLRSELAKERAARLTTEAAAFADRTIVEHKALPAEREAIIGQYTLAATDDLAHGPATFADGKQQSRVEGLMALFAARPAHSLTDETITARDGDAALVNRQATPKQGDVAKMSTDEHEALLAMTDTGRAILAARNGKGA